MMHERVEAAAAQQKWEYHCELIESPERLQEALSSAGKERWELVSMVTLEGQTQAVFKRPQRLFAGRQESPRAAEAAAQPNRPR